MSSIDAYTPVKAPRFPAKLAFLSPYFGYKWLIWHGCERLNALEEAHTLFYEALENISTYLNRFPNGLKCPILVHKRRDKY